MTAVDKNIPDAIVGDIDDDWRLKLLGEKVLLNNSIVDESTDVTFDIETSEQQLQEDRESMPTQAFFEGYEYIALFFGANYCPFCTKFAPSVVAAKQYLEEKKCKTIFVSNDRDQENFDQSCAKVRGLDAMKYDTSKTAVMREIFGLKTIPALIILPNKAFDQDKPEVFFNAREILELDPHCKNFPWGESRQAEPVTAWERLWIHGRHGNWWQVGHRNVSELHPEDMYIDEHAVRARAGLLNICTVVMLMNVFFIQEPDLVTYAFYPFVAWEFLSSLVFGLTPFSPLGWLGTLCATILHPKPLWKPANPKRFAWAIGMTLATTCMVFVQFRKDMGAVYKPAVAAVVFTCFVATWLEGNLGFCVGCYLYNEVIVGYFDREECVECKA
eukprot:CAMPEP_0113654640 /NCGR_PEP_ID=MMETSP0017_2-20120614/29264_1 /TAXON_ID=2856 /ORGANISM="Cylindrotheca closterium" /LENGTH=385 /DNA_ID=CAMNT_0000567801 /DNA_START=430 /DNA_END=1587 /DNA_ORIENTATION=+ /assembly_acc=CAM_ASM_000147